MAIVRNKKVTPEAISAFGSAADARPEPVAPAAPVAAPAAQEVPAQPQPVRTKAPKKTTPGAGESRTGSGPTSSLVRWSDEDLRELRDQLMAYSKNERYSMQEVMTKAMRIGIAQLAADIER